MLRGRACRVVCGVEVAACEELGVWCALWATSAAEVQVCGMVCGGTAVELSRMGCRDCGLGVPIGDRVARGWNASGESLYWHHASRDDDGALGRRFSRWGRHLGATTLLHETL